MFLALAIKKLKTFCQTIKSKEQNINNLSMYLEKWLFINLFLHSKSGVKASNFFCLTNLQPFKYIMQLFNSKFTGSPRNYLSLIVLL